MFSMRNLLHGKCVEDLFHMLLAIGLETLYEQDIFGSNEIYLIGPKKIIQLMS